MITSGAANRPAGVAEAPACARVAVVGAGIAGLAAAHELQQRGAACIVIDAADRAGGVILTERSDGFVIDAGPDSLLAQKAAGIDLCREVGLAERLVDTREPRTAYVVRDGTLRPLPEGSILGVPTGVWPFASSSLFSVAGKLRMGLDLVLPRGRQTDDESVASFVRRRFGDEAVRYLADPLLAGIHSGDSERLSVRALFPRLSDAERTDRSVLLAFKRARPAGPRGSLFRSLSTGLSELVDALVARLPDRSVRLGTRAASLRRESGGWMLRTADGQDLPADAVILAVPAFVVRDLVEPLDQRLAMSCRSVSYRSSATVALGYRRSQITHPLAGSGFVVPRAEDRFRLMAGSFVSSKWPGRAPEGHVLLRAFIGGARNPELLELSDTRLADISHEDLACLLGIDGTPMLTRVFRWTNASAQHEVGHLALVREIEQRLAQHGGLFVTGSGFRATGIADCIADGRATAAAASDFIRQLHGSTAVRDGDRE